MTLLLFLAAPAEAHIILTYPPPRYSQQKDQPCGRANDIDPVNRTEFAPGETVTVQWIEDINHPSHFRISFDDDGQDDFANPASITDFYSNPAVILDDIPDDEPSAIYMVDIVLPMEECDKLHPAAHPGDVRQGAVRSGALRQRHVLPVRRHPDRRPRRHRGHQRPQHPQHPHRGQRGLRRHRRGLPARRRRRTCPPLRRPPASARSRPPNPPRRARPAAAAADRPGRWDRRGWCCWGCGAAAGADLRPQRRRRRGSRRSARAAPPAGSGRTRPGR